MREKRRMFGELLLIDDGGADDAASRAWVHACSEQGRWELGSAPPNVAWNSLVATSVNDRYAGLVAAVAASTDTRMSGSLSARSSLERLTPADRAVQLDCASFLTALAATGRSEVLASLEAPHPDDGLTPLQRAVHLGSRAAFEALIQAGVKQDGLGKVSESGRVWHWLKEIEEAHIMERAHADLSASSRTCPDAGNLVADTRCPVSLEPFATGGARRPVHLVRRNGSVELKQCVSAESARALTTAAAERRQPPKHPLTAEVFWGCAEAPARVALVTSVIDAYRNQEVPVALAQARALEAYELHRAGASTQFLDILARACGAPSSPRGKSGPAL
jgi:hypothetical protein